jgi:pyruvate dehydrogenase E2 component (dihydrolipoamide acetyltransferase)
MVYSDIVLPNLGFGMEEGRLLAWLKQPGDSVRKGEPVAEVESDKASVELEALADGVLDAILVPAEQVVPVGTVLARIRSDSHAPAPTPLHREGEQTSQTPSEASNAEETLEKRGQRVSPVAQRLAREHGLDLATVRGSGPEGRITREDVESVIAPAGNGNGRPMAAPAVRKLARDNGIDLWMVSGTGAGGRIRREDVEALLSPAQTPPYSEGTPRSSREELSSPVVGQAVPLPSPLVGEGAGVRGEDGRREIPISTMRQTIARRLTQSVQEAPHFFSSAELDFTDAIAALPGGIGVNALVLYLCVQTLLKQPELNATYENGHLYHYDHVHLSIAVALPNGLMSPVLRRADDYSLNGLAEHSRDLIERTRAGKLKPDELSGGTFTVSNLGIVKQIDRFTAIINPPQVSILAVGAAKPRPVVMNGGLHIRTTAHLTLSADHRIVDGMLAARFLEAFDDELHRFERTTY